MYISSNETHQGSLEMNNDINKFVLHLSVTIILTQYYNSIMG